MKKVWFDEAWDDYLHWQMQDEYWKFYRVGDIMMIRGRGTALFFSTDFFVVALT